MGGEIKRRSMLVQVFPSSESMLRLVGVVCAEQAQHLARIHAQTGGTRGARARRERGVAQEGAHDRRDGVGARRRGEEGGAML